MGLLGNEKTNANSVLPHVPCQGKKYCFSLSIQGFYRLWEEKMVLHANETSFLSQQTTKAHLEGKGAYVAHVRT